MPFLRSIGNQAFSHGSGLGLGLGVRLSVRVNYHRCISYERQLIITYSSGWLAWFRERDLQGKGLSSIIGGGFFFFFQ